MTGLQERLLLVVHMKKKQIKMRELEIYTLGAMTKENARDLDSLLESYRRLTFPGMKEKKSTQDEQLEAAKKALAEEAKKVLLIRPINKEAMFQRAQKAEASGIGKTNPTYNQIAGKAFVEHERNRMQLLQRQQRAEDAIETRKARREKMKRVKRKPVGKRGGKR